MKIYLMADGKWKLFDGTMESLAPELLKRNIIIGAWASIGKGAMIGAWAMIGALASIGEIESSSGNLPSLSGSTEPQFTPMRMAQSWAAAVSTMNFTFSCQADYAELVPGSVRRGPLTVAYTHADFHELFRAWRALYNLEAVLTAAGTSLAKVVKTTVYLKDMAQFAQMDASYKTFFPENPPARTTIQAQLWGEGRLIVIDAIAKLG